MAINNIHSAYLIKTQKIYLFKTRPLLVKLICVKMKLWHQCGAVNSSVKRQFFQKKDFYMLFPLSESIIIKNVKAFPSANNGRQVNTTSSLFVCIFKFHYISKNNQKQMWQDQYLSRQNAKMRKGRPTDPNFLHFQKTKGTT